LTLVENHQFLQHNTITDKRWYFTYFICKMSRFITL